MRWTTVVTVWLIAASAVLLFSTQTYLGPKVMTLGTRHGVHLTDLVAVAVAVLWARVQLRALARSARADREQHRR